MTTKIEFAAKLDAWEVRPGPPGSNRKVGLLKDANGELIASIGMLDDIYYEARLKVLYPQLMLDLRAAQSVMEELHEELVAMRESRRELLEAVMAPGVDPKVVLSSSLVAEKLASDLKTDQEYLELRDKHRKAVIAWHHVDQDFEALKRGRTVAMPLHPATDFDDLLKLATDWLASNLYSSAVESR